MKCQHEIDAVKRIRERHSNVPQRTLASRIISCRGSTSRRFTYEPSFNRSDFDDCRRISYNTSYATIYNRIRRIDGSIK